MSIRTLRALALGLALFVPVAAPAGAGPAALRVFAAASLTDAFGELARVFEHTHPGLHVQLNFAGSQQLLAQLEQGASADVFASADARSMDEAQTHALVAGEPEIFAHNRLIVIVPATNPARIARLADLARRGTKLVLAADAVPAGRYSREALANLARLPGFGANFATRALANVVSEEENVKSVAGKVQLGEADAGIVYRSDVTPAFARFVRTFEIPDSANVLASYPIATLAGSARIPIAGEFVALVVSPEGQRVLARHGLMPATPAP